MNLPSIYKNRIILSLLKIVTLKFTMYLLIILTYRMIHISGQWKLSNFQDPPTLLLHLRLKFFHPLELGRPISSEPLSRNDNQLKETWSKDDYYMVSGLSFRSALIFSVNSLILSGFPLTSFHLAETSLSAFSWLYTLVCAVVQKCHKMPFINNCSHF